MDKDLLQTVAFDLGVSQYSSETEFQFHNRVIYTALACWIKAACQDQPVMQSNVCEGVSRRHIHDKCSKVLASFLCRYSSSVPWFTTDDSSEDAVSLIRSRLLRHQDIINVGFNTNVALAKCNSELLSNTLEVIRGALFIPQCHYNGISLTRTPAKTENAPQRELIYSSTWLSEYLSSAWWESFAPNTEDRIEYFDATKRAVNMYQCWQSVKPKTMGKYIIARRPVNVSSHEYLVVNTQSMKLHRIDSVLQDFGEHRRFIFALRAEANNPVNGKVTIYSDHIHLKMRTCLPAKETQLLESLAWPHSNITDRLEWDMSLQIWEYIKPFLEALGMVFMEEKHG